MYDARNDSFAQACIFPLLFLFERSYSISNTMQRPRVNHLKNYVQRERISPGVLPKFLAAVWRQLDGSKDSMMLGTFPPVIFPGLFMG